MEIYEKVKKYLYENIGHLTHKHEQDKVLSCHRVTINEVIDEIRDKVA